MDEVSIYDLSKTTKDFIINLIIRIDNLLEEIRGAKRQEIFSYSGVLLILEDFSILAESINIIGQENSSITLEEFMEKLNILYESIKDKDELMFVDVLEFEIRPLLEYWEQVIKFTGHN
ncbi:hypothetical protein NE686_08975 [Tissierella carlieri]|uniref:Uncharacterized protein n=1 Tax=Tissierella carlieri TaxID=689904 RepID=A0ABT1S9Q6_9FIRM|nr:hypothetical protein [Tissierella carlieri]MCQ4923214.1 hypothetical protein [Tissierella carlieri]